MDETKYIPKYDNYGKLITVEEIALKEIFSTKFMRKAAATIDNLLGVPTKTSMKGPDTRPSMHTADMWM
jgi:hypothetical protein